MMILEWQIARKRGLGALFSFGDSIANINVGIAERLADLGTTGLFYAFFLWLYEHCRLFSFEPSWWSYILLFLATDFVWYWYHRLGHRVAILWAAHGVHHQSDDFNFTVSARITVFQAAIRSLFWAVLPVLGFHPGAITVMLLLHGLYPFFTHTQLIGKLGFLEYFLVTPSHHRVHHSSNPEYLDTNYGDVLIIWDKLFGTFAAEQTRPVYGLTKPLNSYSFLWQHFHFFLEIGIAVKRARGLRQKLGVVFGTPDGIDPLIRTALERKLLRRESNRFISAGLRQYILLQTALSIVLLFAILLSADHLAPLQLALGAAFIILSLISTGAMLEQRRWVFALDVGRLGLVAAGLHLSFPDSNLATAAPCIPLIVLALYNPCRRQYLNRLYA